MRHNDACWLAYVVLHHVISANTLTPPDRRDTRSSQQTRNTCQPRKPRSFRRSDSILRHTRTCLRCPAPSPASFSRRGTSYTSWRPGPKSLMQVTLKSHLLHRLTGEEEEERRSRPSIVHHRLTGEEEVEEEEEEERRSRPRRSRPSIVQKTAEVGGKSLRQRQKKEEEEEEEEEEATALLLLHSGRRICRLGNHNMMETGRQHYTCQPANSNNYNVDPL